MNKVKNILKIILIILLLMLVIFGVAGMIKRFRTDDPVSEVLVESIELDTDSIIF